MRKADDSILRVASAERVSSLRIMTANVHKGFTFFNRRFILPELREAVTTVAADVVFLQEVLGTHQRHARRHSNWPAAPQYEYLADTMWPQYAYGRNAVYTEGDHGNALLSRYPILQYENVDITVPGTEQRGLLHSTLDVPGQAVVHTICVHLGLGEKQRRQQLGLLGKLLDSLPNDAPVVVAGDFNDWRNSATAILARHGMHEAFVHAQQMPARTFPARWPWLRLDRVYVRNAETRNPLVLHRKPWSHLSDHVPLVVEIVF